MSSPWVADFDEERTRLLRIGYRMLGSVSEAEDVLQEAYIRWSQTDRSAVRNSSAFLGRIVTRLCLDQLKSARVRRESYVGPWLPEPIVQTESIEDVTLPLLIALERLSPLERAAFLLHDVFGESFQNVADVIGRDVAACRQLASRARVNVREERLRYAVDDVRGMEIAAAFFQASSGEGVSGLSALLAEDVRFHADGGGKRPAVARVLEGVEEVVRAYAAIMHLREGSSELIRYGFVNGLPGFVTREPDGELQTTALLVEEDRIRAIYVMRNPEKLRHLREADRR